MEIPPRPDFRLGGDSFGWQYDTKMSVMTCGVEKCVLARGIDSLSLMNSNCLGRTAANPLARQVAMAACPRPAQLAS